MPFRDADGQFVKTPPGVKTPRMLEVENHLGRTLEDDYEEYYVKKKWGQKRLANRWGVKKATIFSDSMPGGRRSWVTMLDLPVRRVTDSTTSEPTQVGRPACEICGWCKGPLDGAHFIPRAEGGARGWNILQLCPNCHRRLDSGDVATLREAKAVLLRREAARILAGVKDAAEAQHQLLWIAERVLAR